MAARVIGNVCKERRVNEMKRCIVCFIAILLPGISIAETMFSAEINALRANNQGQVVIYMDENDANTTSSVEGDVCRYQNGPSNKFHAKFFTNSDGGKALLSVALSAQARGKPLYMGVIENCEITMLQVR